MKTIVKKGSGVVTNSTGRQRSVVSALSGLFFFGAWAFAVNYSHGSYEAIKSAIVQGSISFSVTLSNTLLMEVLYWNILAKSIRFWGAVVITSVLVYALSWSINTIVGTPELYLTIIPGCVISSIFAYGYVLTLSKNKRNMLSDAPTES